MAHQTFYIDIDEEITSIVDRLRKSKVKEIVIVVPKRALLIQSIVNLKLLQKEAEGLEKKIVIVTQDKLGKLLVEKTGISVEQRLDDVPGEEVVLKSKVKATEEDNYLIKKHKKDVNSIGSSEYFEPDEFAKNTIKETQVASKEDNDEEYERLINKELVAGINFKNEKKRFKSKGNSLDLIKNVDISSTLPGVEKEDLSKKSDDRKRAKVKRNFQKEELYEPEGMKDESEDQPYKSIGKAEDFFQRDFRKSYQKNKDYKEINLSGHFWKYFFMAGLVGIIIAGLAFSYLYLPKATIKIFVKSKSEKMDVEIKGDVKAVSADFGEKIMPATVVNDETEVSKDFKATGSSTASNQKARGSVTIYNEYSSAPQILIATTRLESPDGKIFRLTKAVTVPGMSNSDPGAVEADVVSDEPGEGGNIDVAKFSIPGFKGSGTEKYSKFYAKSFKPMIGGGSGNGTITTVSQNDINKAKEELALEIIKKAKEKIISQSGQEKVILEDAMNVTDTAYTFSHTEGEPVENFSGTAKAKVSTIVYAKKDFNELAKNFLSKSQINNDDFEKLLSVQYGKIDADAAKGTLTVRAHLSLKNLVDWDENNLKKGILGKKEEELLAFFKNYPDIEKVELSYRPAFFSGKIPNYTSRIDIILDSVDAPK